MMESNSNDYLRSDLREALQSAAIGIYVLLFLILLALYSQNADAKTIYFGNEATAIRVSAGMPTLLRFPKEVKNILRGDRFTIKPASEESPNYSVLSIEPRFSSGSSEVLFLLADGQTISLKITIVSKDISASTNYIFEPREESDSKEDVEENKSTTGEVDLLKQIIRGDKPIGYSVTDLSREIENEGPIKIKLVRLYQSNQFTGYVFKLKNESYKKEIQIDVRNLAIGKPNLAILSQIDEATLSKDGKLGSETYLRVVTKSGSSSRNLIIPMKDAFIKSEQSAGVQ